MTQAVRLSSTALGVHRCCLIFDFGDSAKWYVPRCLLPVIQPTSLLGLQPFLRTQKIRRPDPGRTLPEHRSLNDSSWKVISFTTSIDCDRSSGSAASSVRPTQNRFLFRDNSLQQRYQCQDHVEAVEQKMDKHHRHIATAAKVGVSQRDRQRNQRK